MSKKKNYLSNEELKTEILNCINDGYNKAVANGYEYIPPFPDSDSPKLINNYENAKKLGYMPERSMWIQQIKKYDPEKTNQMVMQGEMSNEEAAKLNMQMKKPIVSDKLGRMFNLIVENVSKNFYWANPDDGMDCKANALLDLCSNFWKFEPIDSNGKAFSAFAFCTQIAFFGIAGEDRILHPKKYKGTISLSCIDENGKNFDSYNI